MNESKKIIDMSKETIDVVKEIRDIAEEIKESFWDYTERKVNPEDAQEKAFLEMDKAIRAGEDVDTIMEKIGCFQFEAEKDAFNAGASTIIKIISEKITEYQKDKE